MNQKYAITRIEGACHCNNIAFTLLWPEQSPLIQGRECGCSFCQKHRGVWTSHPDAELSVRIADESSCSKYRFGTETAEFYVCAVCGVVPFVASEFDGHLYAVVSVNAFAPDSNISHSVAPVDFDGEQVGNRLERRRRNWIAKVSFD